MFALSIGLLIPQAQAKKFYPIYISPSDLALEPEVTDIYAKLNVKLSDDRWNFVTVGRQDKYVQIEKIVVDMMMDLKKSVLNQTPAYVPGSEQLFNHFNAYKPNYSSLIKIDGVLNFITGALLLMPPGPGFFMTETGSKLRTIFSKLRKNPTDKANLENLNHNEKELLSAYMGGLLWRLRGGGLLKKRGTQHIRTFYIGYGFQSLGKLVNKNIEEITHAYQSQLVYYGWGEFFDIGYNPAQRSETYDMVKMTERGLIQVRTSLPYLRDLKGRRDTLIASGLQMGPCYFWSWQEFKGVQEYPELQPPFRPFLHGFPTSWGEVCTGAALGIGLYRTFAK
jgi:hypothetical protein